MKRLFAILSVVATVLALFSGGSAYAVDYTWDGSTDLWSSAHWLPGSVAGPTGSSNANSAIIDSGTVSFAKHDTFGNAATTSSPVITVNGGTLASGGWFTTIWNLNMNGGTLLANGGANATYPAFQLAGTLTVGGSTPSTITAGSGSYNMINIGGNGNGTLTLNVANVTGDDGADLTIDNVLQTNPQTTGSLAKTGAGTVVLTGANTYTGNTTVSAGTLIVNGSYSGPASGSRFLVNGGSLTFDMGSGSATFYANGYGTSPQIGNGAYTGLLTLDSGTLNVLTQTGAGTSYGSLIVGSNSTSANGTIVVNDGILNVQGRILMSANAGTAAQGTLTINGGEVNLGISGAYTTSGDPACGVLWFGTGKSTVNLNGGTLAMYGTKNSGATATSSFNFNGGTLQAVANNNTDFLNLGNMAAVVQSGGATIDTAGFDVTIGVALTHDGTLGATPDGGLTKIGGGTLTLSGANTYTGATIVTDGTLDIAASGSLTATSLVNSISGGVLTISGNVTVADNGAFAVGNGTSGLGTVNIDTGAVVNIGNGSGGYVGRTYLGGKLDGNGSLGTGTLNINGGTLNIAAGGTAVTGDGTRFWINAWGNGGTSTLNLNGGTLSTAREIRDGGGGGSVVNFNGGTLQAAANVTLLAAVTTANVNEGGLIVDTNGFSATISPALSHGSGSPDGGLTKIGDGTLTLSGASTFTGDVLVQGGTLVTSVQANNANPTATGLGNMTTAGRTVTVSSGAALVFNASDAMGSYQYKTPVLLVADGGTISNGSGRFMAIGDIVLENGGTLSTANGAATGYQAFNLRGSVTVSGTSRSYITTTGTTNNGIHLGGTTIPATTFNVGVTGDPTADLIVSVPLLDEVYNVGGLIKTGAGTMVLSVANSFRGDVTVDEGVLQAGTSGARSGTLGSTTATRTITVNDGGTLRFSSHDTFGNAATNPSNITIVINEGGTVESANTFTTFGPIELNGGALVDNGGANSNYKAFQLKGTVTVGGTAASMISVSGGTNNGVHLVDTTFDVGDVVSGNDLVVSATLLNQPGGSAGSLTKTGDGAMVLTAANTYSGTTTVSGGTLLVNGTHSGMGAYTVAGGTLGGSGTIAAPVTVATSGTLAPGTSPGILTLESGVTFEAGTFSVEINGLTVGDDYDQLLIGSSGIVDLGSEVATLAVSSTGYSPGPDDFFWIINNTNTDTGATTGYFQGLAVDGSSLQMAGRTFYVYYHADIDSNQLTGGNDVLLTSVPEPSTVVLLLAALGTLACWYWRRRAIGGKR